MTEAGDMLNKVVGRLAILELAAASLSDEYTLKGLSSVKQGKFNSQNYCYELSQFIGETLVLTMNCQIELDRLEGTLQHNAQESSKKKGA